MSFPVNDRLLAGGFIAGHINGCVVLLKNDRRFPWFIVVPKIPDGLEDLDELDPVRFAEIMDAMRKVSAFTRGYFAPEKLNVACIGNIVRQMHIHIVARNPTDPAWPGVVWAHPGKDPYQSGESEKILESFREKFPEN